MLCKRGRKYTGTDTFTTNAQLYSLVTETTGESGNINRLNHGVFIKQNVLDIKLLQLSEKITEIAPRNVSDSSKKVTWCTFKENIFEFYVQKYSTFHTISFNW